MTTQEINNGNLKNQRFILPILFEGAPNPAVMICGEIRVVKNPKHEHYGKAHIYTDSHYEPLNIHDYITIEDAESTISEVGCIKVKDDFDQYSIEDLKEIKSQLPEKWVYWFNAANEAYK